MPMVTIVNSKLTIQMPKYSDPVPVNRTASGAGGGGDAGTGATGLAISFMYKSLWLVFRLSGLDDALRD
jgi:hypothetical protein